MTGSESPRRHSLTAWQALGIAAACVALLSLLTALLPGPA
jgi:hypothetical protein